MGKFIRLFASNGDASELTLYLIGMACVGAVLLAIGLWA